MHFEKFRKQWARAGLVLVVTLAAIVAHPVWAALPTVDQPTSGGSNTNWMTTLQGYTRDGAQIAVLVIGFLGLAVVGSGAVGAFFNYRRGKEELGDVLTKTGVGVAMVMFVTFLLSIATGII